MNYFEYYKFANRDILPGSVVIIICAQHILVLTIPFCRGLRKVH